MKKKTLISLLFPTIFIGNIPNSIAQEEMDFQVDVIKLNYSLLPVKKENYTNYHIQEVFDKYDNKLNYNQNDFRVNIRGIFFEKNLTNDITYGFKFKFHSNNQKEMFYFKVKF